MMKLVKINTKNLRLNPKRLFRSGSKQKYSPSKSDPPSFGSGMTSSSSSTSDLKAGVAGSVTPTSVLPGRSCDLSDFSPDVHFELAEAFKLIDRDNDGIVSRKELEALLSRLAGGGAASAGSLASQEVVATMLREVDGGDGQGSIRVEALMDRVTSASGGEAAGDLELKEAFDFFDADRDGRITAEELFGFFTAIGDDGCTLEDCRRMIDGVDRSGEGFVCFEDFSRMMELQRIS